MIYEQGVPTKIFELIASGQKTVEGRPSKNPKTTDYEAMKPGDEFDFLEEIVINPRRLKTKILRRAHYQNVKELLQTEGLQNVLPGVTTIEDGIALYESIDGYLQRIERDGIWAIQFEIMQ